MIYVAANVERALYGRVSDFADDQIVSPPFRVHNPHIEGISDSQTPTNVKAGKSCMNWVICDPEVEFVNTKTGKTLDDKPSRICKMSLFIKFVNIFSHFSNVKRSTVSIVSYETFKEKSQTYQQIKRALFEFLEKNGRGKWVRKPREINSFGLNEDILSEHS